MNLQRYPHSFRRLLQIQISVALLAILAAFFFRGYLGAWSAVLACLVYGLPNFCFAHRLFQYQGARAAKQIVKGFYRGEALKFGLSVVLFILVFANFIVVPGVFFSVYLLMPFLIRLMLFYI